MLIVRLGKEKQVLEGCSSSRSEKTKGVGLEEKTKEFLGA